MNPWTVVVGVDGTPQARDAVDLGRKLAQVSDGEWHLVTVAADPLGYTVATTAGMDVTALDEAVRDDAWRQAAEGLRGLLTPKELERRLRVGIGRPEAVLAQQGAEVEADLFVLGGHPRGRPRTWLHRSTARHLIRVSDRPVLVTGPEGAALHRVLAAVDFGPAAQPVMDLARVLARALDIPFDAVHVVHHPRIPSGREFLLDGETLMATEEAEVRSLLWTDLPDDAGRTVVRGPPVGMLEELAGRAPGTLLVLGAQGRGWVDRLLIGSTTEAILSDLPCALAVVPARAVERRSRSRSRAREPTAVG